VTDMLTVADIPFATTGNEGIELPSPSDPMAVARRFIADCYEDASGDSVLRSYRGDFYRWDGTHYLTIAPRDMRQQAYQYVEHAVWRHPKKHLVPYAPTQRKITDLVDALHAAVGLASGLDAPLWIDGRQTPCVTETVAMANGLLDVRRRILHPHTPQFFTSYVLPFDYDPSAIDAPRWRQFLEELFVDDDQARQCLQEVVGYLLAGGTEQQKMFLLVGPKRAGKGTLARVITGLLGPHHVAAPTLASLGTNFGLAPLIGKPLAIISDARLSTRAESHVVVERLLSISGEDSLSIDMKFRDAWTGRLPTRFLILSNELPRLSDASGALVSRFILFVLQRSFYQHENPHLTGELLEEAPAIFNWALEGLDRLQLRGYFRQPDSSAEVLQQMEDLSSPVGAFVRDRCEVHCDASVDVEALWNAWKNWCEESNTTASTKAVFGRDLRAVVPTLKLVRPRESGERVYRYAGLGFSNDFK